MSGHRFDISEAGDQLDDLDEAVRIFIGKEGGGNAFLIQPQSVGEPMMFGMMCVDLMKHGAIAFAQANGTDAQEAFRKIVAGFTAEMQKPTDKASN